MMLTLWKDMEISSWKNKNDLKYYNSWSSALLPKSNCLETFIS